MVRRTIYLFACWALASGLWAESLHLKGFKLVDPATRQIKETDLYIKDGQVTAGPLKDARVIQGNGRWLIPLMADLKMHSWGNESAYDWDILAQEMDGALSAKIQLYYGVGLVVPWLAGGDWMNRFFDRLEHLRLNGAKVIRGGGIYRAASEIPWPGPSITHTAQVAAAIDKNLASGAELVQVSYASKENKFFPAVSKEVLVALLEEAKKRKLPSMVLVYSWAHAAEAARLGADAIYAVPEGLPSSDQLSALKKSGTVFIPGLCDYLDLAWWYGHPQGLNDAFLKATVPDNILESFRDPSKMWGFWETVLAYGKVESPNVAKWLKMLEKAEVKIGSGTGAGWTAGPFQGYSTHRNQWWMEKAGVKPWTRLQAATTVPRQLLRMDAKVFDTGASADYFSVDADPLGPSENLRNISLLIRQGREVDRESLKPDLKRQRFRP